MRAGHVWIMPDISTKATIVILAPFEPSNDFLYFFFGQLMIKGSQTGQRPIAACDFKMFSQVLSNGMEVFTVFETECVFEMLLSVEGRDLRLVLHKVMIWKILIYEEFLRCKSEVYDDTIISKSMKS